MTASPGALVVASGRDTGGSELCVPAEGVAFVGICNDPFSGDSGHSVTLAVAGAEMAPGLLDWMTKHLLLSEAKATLPGGEGAAEQRCVCGGWPHGEGRDATGSVPRTGPLPE